MRAGFVGKTALITGAGRGIGAAIATGLAKAGADVILLARTADQLDEIANTIRASAPLVKVRVVTADLADDTKRATAIDDLLAGGPVDVLINNAATVEPLGDSGTISPNQLRSESPTHRYRPARPLCQHIRLRWADHRAGVRQRPAQPSPRRGRRSDRRHLGPP